MYNYLGAETALELQLGWKPTLKFVVAMKSPQQLYRGLHNRLVGTSIYRDSENVFPVAAEIAALQWNFKQPITDQLFEIKTGAFRFGSLGVATCLL
jgi:hypothetical protein